MKMWCCQVKVHMESSRDPAPEQERIMHQVCRASNHIVFRLSRSGLCALQVAAAFLSSFPFKPLPVGQIDRSANP